MGQCNSFPIFVRDVVVGVVIAVGLSPFQTELRSWLVSVKSGFMSSSSWGRCEAQQMQSTMWVG